MKYVLFVLLVLGDSITMHMQEFDSRNACEAAGSRLIEELRKGVKDGYSIGTKGTRTWCVEKG